MRLAAPGQAPAAEYLALAGVQGSAHFEPQRSAARRDRAFAPG